MSKTTRARLYEVTGELYHPHYDDTLYGPPKFSWGEITIIKCLNILADSVDSLRSERNEGIDGVRVTDTKDPRDNASRKG
jgi:hypothetical protein